MAFAHWRVRLKYMAVCVALTLGVNGRPEGF